MAKEDDSVVRDQAHVNRAVQAREARRSARDSGAVSLEKALAHPINTFTGEGVPQLGDIGDQSEDVCFGSLVDLENERKYVGKFPIYDASRDLLVISWKSKIGGLFYLSNIKDSRGLKGTSRITFGRPNKVVSVEENLYSELETRIQNLTRSSQDEVSDAVLNELEKGSSGSLKDIVKTIHASQYEIISAPRNGLHVIQGAPGTGKTVVGVHRVSWLLFPGNDKDLRAERTLIVGPNTAFIRYIENVIPSLGEENITHRDLAQLSPMKYANVHDAREVAKIKGDPRMKELLLQGIYDRLKIPEVDIEYKVPNVGQRILISHLAIREKIEASWAELIVGQGRVGLVSMRLGFRRWLLSVITNEVNEPRPGMGRFSQEKLNLRESDLDALTEKIWPTLNPSSFLRDFLGSQGKILNAARNLDFLVKDLTVLVRKPSEQAPKEVWTTSDVPLLDFLGSYIYGPDASDQFDYIVVDEAQDMTPMQLDSIRRRSVSGDVLLMGDLAQATGTWVPKTWAEIAGYLGAPINRFDELQFGYRVPKQVFELAGRVLSHIDPKLEAPKLVRDVSENPQLFIESNQESLVQSLIEFVGKIPTSGRHVGLIVSDQQVVALSQALIDSKIPFVLLENTSPVEGLNLVPVSLQKGLESDDVVIFDPHAVIQIPEIGLRQLYVALTRSLRRLAIFALSELPTELVETLDKVEFSNHVLQSISIQNSDHKDLASLEIHRDIEGYLRVKGLSLKRLIQILTEK